MYTVPEQMTLMNVLHEMAGIFAHCTMSVSNVKEQIYDTE